MHTSPNIHLLIKYLLWCGILCTVCIVCWVWGAPWEWMKGSTYSSKVWTWQNLNIYVQALLWNRNSRSTGQCEGGRGEKYWTWERVEKGSRLSQAPEHPTAGPCVAGGKLQTKGFKAKQLLLFIVLLLVFVCLLWTVVQMLLCWVQSGRRERRCSFVFSRLSCSQGAELACPCQSLSVRVNHSQESEVQFEAKMAAGKPDRGWMWGAKIQSVDLEKLIAAFDWFFLLPETQKEEKVKLWDYKVLSPRVSRCSQPREYS